MRFQVNRDVFSESASFVARLLPARATVPVLSGVLMSSTDDGISFSSFDYEVSSTTAVVADVEEPGRVLVSGRLLNDIAARLPQAPVTVFTEESRVRVTCGSASFSLPSMPVEEYPTIPSVDTRSGVLPGEAFAEAVAQVSVAASKDDVTPVITGVQLEVGDGSLSLVATDRYRVAVRDIEWQAEGTEPGTTALVPVRTIVEVGKAFGHASTVEVAIVSRDDRELIAFSSDRRTITSLLIKGNFPPVKRLFPDNVENYAVVNTGELIEATTRVQTVLEREAALRFSFSADGLTLEAAGSEQAQASESVDATLTGSEIVVSLKPQFLLEGLRATHSEFTRISFTRTENPNKPGPVLITAQTSRDQQGTDAYRYLLQPNLLLR